MTPEEMAKDASPRADDNEEIVDPDIPEGNVEVVVIRRHIFGLVLLIVEIIIGVALALGLLFILLPLVGASNSARSILALGSVVVIALAAIVIIVATFLYRDNRLMITDDSITQRLRVGLFKINTTSLSMANIEDVTSDRNGVFAQIFGYGLLKIETAGEVPYFHFAFCPKSDIYAKVILDARERFINENPQAAKRANPLLEVPKG